MTAMPSIRLGLAATILALGFGFGSGSARALDSEQVDSAQDSASKYSIQPLSEAEIGMIRAQIYRCWNIPARTKDAKDPKVDIRARLLPDGSVISADIVDSERYTKDASFRAAANSARRAVLLCSPIKAPPTKYNLWKDLTLRFNPREMLGQ